MNTYYMKKSDDMKFYIEKGKENEIKASYDDNKELMFLITLTESQVKDLSDGKTIVLKERKKERRN